MIVQAGAPFAFVYTAYDEETGLSVRAGVWDVTGVPALVANVVMPHVSHGSYVGTFTGENGKTYLIEETVYTDGTYSTPDPDRSPGSEAVQCVMLSSAEALDAIVARLEVVAQILNGKAGCGLTGLLSAQEFDAEVDATEIDGEVEVDPDVNC